MWKILSLIPIVVLLGGCPGATTGLTGGTVLEKCIVVEENDVTAISPLLGQQIIARNEFNQCR